MSDRSLRTVVTDSFSAPRWVHHLVKIATGLVVFGVFLGVVLWCAPLTAAAVCSLLWLGTTKVAYTLDHGTPLVKPDLWCDLALHCLPLVLIPRDWRVSGALAVLCVGTYLATYPEASP